MRKTGPLFLIASLLLAGCSSGGGSDDDATLIEEPEFEDGVITVANPNTLPRDVPAAGERTLAKAPEWRLGEYWTYRMTDGFTGTEYEFTRVVAGVDKERDIYLVGFPVETFNNDIMVFHIPGFGDITRSDLSYETHDAVFKPLDFPLEDGAAWPVSFEGVADGEAVVTVQGDGTALIEMAVSVYGNIVARYDPEVGEIVSMDIGDGSYATYEIVEHGYGYEGVVRVPHDHDLLFNHARVAGVVGGNLAPAGPSDEVTVDGLYDRISFIIALGGGEQFLGVPTAGHFSVKVTASDGTVYEESLTPVDIALGTSLKIVAIGHEAPQGSWTFEHIAGGVGLTLVEGIGYHSIDFDLPSGCVIESANAGHHSMHCKTAGGPAGNGSA